MNKESKAYNAGFFDGEGCVYIRKTNAKGYKEGIRYDLVCSISQRRTEELYRLKEDYGGCVSLYKSRSSNSSWGRWSVVCNDAVVFLNDIRPHARLKRNEIDLALKFQSTKGVSGKNITDKQKAYQEEVYLALKQLKKLGGDI
jgi:hypothetical protein